eukprot:6460247-Amphidinium_carterae.1
MKGIAMKRMKECRRGLLRGGVEQGAEEGKDIGEGGLPHHQVVDRFFAMPPLSLTRLDSSRSPSGVLDG